MLYSYVKEYYSNDIEWIIVIYFINRIGEWKKLDIDDFKN